MKIRNKIIIFMFLWLTTILLCIHMVVYFLFFKIATENEIATLQHKGEHIIFQLGPQTLLIPGQEKKMLRHLSENSMIRVINYDRHAVNLLHNRFRLNEIEPSLTDEIRTELIRNEENHRILIVRLPIYTQDQLIGTLEMAEMLLSLESNASILITVLVIATFGGAVLSLMGAISVSRVILEPITRLIGTMENIERSLQFEKIPLPKKPKDELYKLTMTFNRMIGRIKVSFRQQKRFVADASHELKTTLTIIESYANLLRRWGTEDEEVRQEAVHTIHSEAQRMKKMTQQLLEIASFEIQHDIEREPIELVEYCHNLSRLIHKIYKRNCIVIAEEEEFVVSAEKMKLRQLLLILIDNAIKYSKDKIEIRLRRGDSYISIGVKDYGIGIPEDEIKYVFERFYRVDKARRRKTGGTGLGLAIAREIVDEHGGRILVDSEEGAGTEVMIFLPIIDK